MCNIYVLTGQILMPEKIVAERKEFKKENAGTGLCYEMGYENLFCCFLSIIERMGGLIHLLLRSLIFLSLQISLNFV